MKINPLESILVAVALVYNDTREDKIIIFSFGSVPFYGIQNKIYRIDSLSFIDIE